MVSEAITNAIDYLKSVFANIYSKLLVAVLILIIGFVLGKIIGRITERLMHELEIDNIIKKATKIDLHLEHLFSVFVTYFIYFITIIMTLNQLNVTTTVLQMISAGVIIIMIISVALAIKDFIPNAMAGFYLYRHKFMNEGETVRVKGMEGKIVHISLVETKLETKDGDVVYIPNSALTKTELIKVQKEAKRAGRRTRKTAKKSGAKKPAKKKK